MKSSGSTCFLIFPGLEVRLRLGVNVWLHICKVSALRSLEGAGERVQYVGLRPLQAYIL